MDKREGEEREWKSLWTRAREGGTEEANVRCVNVNGDVDVGVSAIGNELRV